MPLHVAQFVHRYPPALGGAEAYTAQLGEHLAACGDAVDVWTTTAVDLAEMWGNTASTSRDREGAVADPARQATAPSRSRLVNTPTVHRFPPLAFPLRRYVLKALSLIPHRPWQLLTAPSSPTCPGMWRAANRYDGPLDAVHAVAFPYGFHLMCGLRLARRRRVPFLLTPFLHLGDPLNPADRTRRQYTRPALRWLLNQADRVFVQTPSEFRLAHDLDVPESRLVLQGLGVDAGECTGGDRAAARQAWGVDDEAFVVGHLANNSVEKGTVDLLRTLLANRDRDRAGTFLPPPLSKGGPGGVSWFDSTPPAPPLERGGGRFVLAGPQMPNFARFWDTYPHKHLVTRLGVLTDAQKRDFFAGVDAFALPSRTDSFGLVLLEAWANGKPVVAYRAGGPADLIRDGVDGFLVRCGDVDELAARLAQLANDPESAQRMGEAGRSRLASEFTWERSLNLVRDTLQACVNGGGGA